MLAMTHGWQATERDEYVVAAKGAPEAIADLCHLVRRETATHRRAGGPPGRRRACACWLSQGAFEGQRLTASQHGFRLFFSA